MRGAYLERLVIKLKLKLRQMPEKAIFSLEVGNRFSALTDNEEQDIVNQWKDYKYIYDDTAQNTEGSKKCR